MKMCVYFVRFVSSNAANKTPAIDYPVRWLQIESRSLFFPTKDPRTKKRLEEQIDAFHLSHLRCVDLLLFSP